MKDHLTGDLFEAIHMAAQLAPTASAAGASRAGRLTMAIPAKGRLRQPTVALLSDAGMSPEHPDERALAFPCQAAPVDVLLVRAPDIAGYVSDGVVDCGVTGADLVRESDTQVVELLRLGYGRCTLEVAVPEEAAETAIEELHAKRVATVHPRLTRELLSERGVDAEIVVLSGSTELAPRLGLADGIVDLVSSGDTLRRHALRSLGPLFFSEAVLIGPASGGDRVSELILLLGAVVEARAARVLMLMVPERTLAEARELLAGARSLVTAPTERPGFVALQAVVAAAELWT
ncbi:MAG: ATP phosphoribosyltransferase, partial [Actinomycetota bacterium]|nr:ATP phosphoribosyltransferase [Actinomycetota bacterium]